MNLTLALATVAGLGSAIAGGVYANFSARVMPQLASLPGPEGIATMQHFNRNAVQAPFMTVFFGTAATSALLLVRILRAPERPVPELLAAGGATLHLVGFVLTIAYHVPRNDRLAAVEASSVEAAAVWNRYLQEWTAGNSVRAVVSLVGAAALLASAALCAART